MGAVELGEAVGPRRSVCPKCGEAVLLLMLANTVVAVDLHESLPRMRCPDCYSRIPTRRLDCERCGGTGVIGGLPPDGFCVSSPGRSRVFHGRRRHGESVHVLHRCA